MIHLRSRTWLFGYVLNTTNTSLSSFFRRAPPQRAAARRDPSPRCSSALRGALQARSLRTASGQHTVGSTQSRHPVQRVGTTRPARGERMSTPRAKNNMERAALWLGLSPSRTVWGTRGADLGLGCLRARFEAWYGEVHEEHHGGSVPWHSAPRIRHVWGEKQGVVHQGGQELFLDLIFVGVVRSCEVDRCRHRKLEHFPTARCCVARCVLVPLLNVVFLSHLLGFVLAFCFGSRIIPRVRVHRPSVSAKSSSSAFTPACQRMVPLRWLATLQLQARIVAASLARGVKSKTTVSRLGCRFCTRLHPSCACTPCGRSRSGTVRSSSSLRWYTQAWTSCTTC